MDRITIFVGIVGVLFGILRFYISWKRGKVQLVVVPKLGVSHGLDSDGNEAVDWDTNSRKPGGMEPTELGFTIENVGAVEATIDQVGLLHKYSTFRTILPTPMISDGKHWPNRLKPHESVTAYYHIVDLFDVIDFSWAHKAFATTQSGKIVCGSSTALKEHRKRYLKQLELPKNVSGDDDEESPDLSTIERPDSWLTETLRALEIFVWRVRYRFG